MIEVKNLTKRYGSNLALNHIHFSLEEGTILGFLGPNGAGKSTTMNIITGYLSPTEGSITVDGFDTLENPLEAKKRIGYLPEIPPLYTDMTVKEYLNFMYDLKKVKLPRKEHIAEICSLVKIDDVYGRLIANLSKGYRQRVGIAQALLGSPEAVMLDEPTVGLDPRQIIEIRDLIHELGEQRTVILSSHILSEVQAVCGTVLIISRGRLVACDTPENLEKVLAGGHTLEITAEAAPEDVSGILAQVSGIERADLTALENGFTHGSLTAAEGLGVERELFFAFARANIALTELHAARASLEEVFLELTASDPAEGGGME